MRTITTLMIGRNLCIDRLLMNRCRYSCIPSNFRSYMTRNIVSIATNKNESSIQIEEKVIPSTTNNMKLLYETLKSTSLCGVPCIILSSPVHTKHVFRFTDDDTFQALNVIRIDTPVRDNDLKEMYINLEKIDCSVCTDLFCVNNDDIYTEELIFGRHKEKNNKSRLNKFIGGRIALRRALQVINKGESPPILTDEYGAPTLPLGIIGSISHKDDFAVGVAAIDHMGRVGVDIERCYNKAADALSRRLLTQREQESLGKIPNICMEEEVLLRFSFKESVYKALHPFLKRSISFLEVEVFPNEDGTADIVFLLNSKELFKYEAVWLKFNNTHWITCVYLFEEIK